MLSAAPDYQTKIMSSLRLARTAKELKSIIDGVVKNVTAITVPETAGTTLSLSAMLDAARNPDVKPLAGLNTKTIKKKEKFNEQVRSLSQSIAEMGVAYQILKSKPFTAFKDQNEAAERLLDVISTASDMRENAVRLISIDVRSEAPVEHRTMSAQLANYLSTVLDKKQYGTITMRTFVAGTDPITFQTFISPSDLVNCEGTEYPEFSIVLTTQVDVDRKAVQHFVTAVADSKVPNSFHIGREVDGLASAKKRVNSALQTEGFLNWGKSEAPKGAGAQTIRAVRYRNQGLNIFIDPWLYLPENGNKRAADIQELVALASAVLLGRGSKLSYEEKFSKTKQPYLRIPISGTLTSDQVDRLSRLFSLSPKGKAAFIASL